jgi:hypothetical protein
MSPIYSRLVCKKTMGDALSMENRISLKYKGVAPPRECESFRHDGLGERNRADPSLPSL